MKKIILMMALAIGTSTAFAQGVIGTDGTASKDFDFQTNGTRRARWLSNGQLLFGTNSAWDPADQWTDKYGLNDHSRKVLFTYEYDLVMDEASHIFLDATSEIRGGEYGTSPSNNHYRSNSGAWPSTPNYSYLQMSNAGDGSVCLDSRSDEIFLQPSGSGVVHVGRTYNASITTTNDKLYVDGSATAKGYCASIKEVTGGSYTVTNDDYTLLLDMDSGAYLDLPTSTVEHGRIFNIKNIGSNAVNVKLADNGSDYSLGTPNKGITIQVLYNSSGSTWTYHIISTM